MRTQSSYVRWNRTKVGDAIPTGQMVPAPMIAFGYLYLQRTFSNEFNPFTVIFGATCRDNVETCKHHAQVTNPPPTLPDHLCPCGLLRFKESCCSGNLEKVAVSQRSQRGLWYRACSA
eukprot:820906-Amphidinium_carterae.2